MSGHGGAINERVTKCGDGEPCELCQARKAALIAVVKIEGALEWIAEAESASHLAEDYRRRMFEGARSRLRAAVAELEERGGAKP